MSENIGTEGLHKNNSELIKSLRSLLSNPLDKFMKTLHGFANKNNKSDENQELPPTTLSSSPPKEESNLSIATPRRSSIGIFGICPKSCPFFFQDYCPCCSSLTIESEADNEINAHFVHQDNTSQIMPEELRSLDEHHIGQNSNKEILQENQTNPTTNTTNQEESKIHFHSSETGDVCLVIHIPKAICKLASEKVVPQPQPGLFCQHYCPNCPLHPHPNFQCLSPNRHNCSTVTPVEAILAVRQAFEPFHDRLRKCRSHSRRRSLCKDTKIFHTCDHRENGKRHKSKSSSRSRESSPVSDCSDLISDSSPSTSRRTRSKCGHRKKKQKKSKCSHSRHRKSSRPKAKKAKQKCDLISDSSPSTSRRTRSKCGHRKKKQKKSKCSHSRHRKSSRPKAKKAKQKCKEKEPVVVKVNRRKKRCHKGRS